MKENLEEVTTPTFFVQPGYSVTLSNTSFRRTNVNNDLEGPEKGCEISRYISPKPPAPPCELLLILLEKITFFFCQFNSDLLLCYN